MTISQEFPVKCQGCGANHRTKSGMVVVVVRSGSPPRKRQYWCCTLLCALPVVVKRKMWHSFYSYSIYIYSSRVGLRRD